MNRVTLGVAVYNSSRFLQDLFASLQKQTVLPCEIIFSDDCSSDNSLSLLTAFKRDFAYDNVRILTNKTNLGIAGNYNRIIQQATGDWIHILDADDYLLDDYYSKVFWALSPELSCIITRMKTSSTLLNTTNRLLISFVPHNPPVWLPLLGSFSTRSAILYRKEIIEQENFEDPIYEGSDIWHLIQVRLQGPALFLKKPCVFYRIYPGASSRSELHGFLKKIKILPLLMRLPYYIDVFARKKLFGIVRKLMA